MAVDTAEKRKSAAGTSFGYCGIIPGVTPNSSKDQEWRQQAGWGYSGILADEPGEDIVGGQWVAGTRYSPGFKAGDIYK